MAPPRDLVQVVWHRSQRAKSEIDDRVRRAGEILQLAELPKRKAQAALRRPAPARRARRAIVREPVAFLMDEPLSNLDAKLRVETRSEILKLQRRLGTTTIYVTHDQVEATTMGERIAVMRDGVLQQVGPPEELYTRPRNQFVPGVIGSPAMNFVPGGALPGMNEPDQTVGFRPGHVGLGRSGDGSP